MELTPERIVSDTNKALFQFLKKGDVSVLTAGIAVILPKKVGEDKFSFLPCILSDNGEAQYIGPEDYFDIIIYHRVLSMVPVLKPTQYGRSNNLYSTRMTMTMVVFIDMTKIGKLPHNLASEIILQMPKSFIFNSQSTNITVVQINTNSLQVFQEEFNGSTPYFLRPEQSIFRINYQIEGNLNAGCLNSCK